jgi:hypothetical protein
MIVAVIPVFGRLPLLKYTINRLIKKNGVDAVVCVGKSIEEEIVCTHAGAYFVKHENLPLGAKWNAGFKKAKELGATAVLFVGSSDWLSDNWLTKLKPLLNEYDLIGKPDFTMIDFKRDDIRMCKWEGYEGARANEPIGIGRLVSKRILDKMDWTPFEPERNNSMDNMMFNKCLQFGGKVKLVTDEDLIPLSISCDAWVNMHKFQMHWTNKIPKNNIIYDNHEIAERHFPEYRQFYNDLYGM